jgi:hypothetical protein
MRGPFFPIPAVPIKGIGIFKWLLETLWNEIDMGFGFNRGLDP